MMINKYIRKYLKYRPYPYTKSNGYEHAHRPVTYIYYIKTGLR